MEYRNDHQLREALQEAVFLIGQNRKGEMVVHVVFDDMDAALRAREAFTVAHPGGELPYVLMPDASIPFYELRVLGNTLDGMTVERFAELYGNAVKGTVAFPEESRYIVNHEAGEVHPNTPVMEAWQDALKQARDLLNGKNPSSGRNIH